MTVVVEQISAEPYLAGEGDDNAVYEDLVGAVARTDRTKGLSKMLDPQLPMVLLGMVAAGIESDMEPELHPWAEPRYHREDLRPRFRAWLTWLASCGYTLAECEHELAPQAKKAAAKKAAPAKKATKAVKKPAARA